ncbi:MAG: RNA methyltransferase [Candidatus Promineofilum sp.]|nr:RNA methyltransferase [Promineifilum sp.]
MMTAMSSFTSPSNPRIKQIRSLAQRKQRDKTGLGVAEGIFHVGEALAAGAVVYLVYAPDVLISPFGRELVEKAAAAHIPVYAVAAEVMASIADKDNPQGLLAVVGQQHARLDECSAVTHPWLVALVNPQDPGNVGTILRTIDAVGASGLVLLEGGVDPYHPAAIRASMGTLFRVPVVSTSFTIFAGWARDQGYRIYGTSARGRSDYRQVGVYSAPLVLLLGSEREGLSAGQAAVCDDLLRLPMHGHVRSLNLAVAAGVFLYAMLDSLAEQAATEPKNL